MTSALYDFYRGPVDLSLVYRATRQGRSVTFLRATGETLEQTALRLLGGQQPLVIERADNA